MRESQVEQQQFLEMWTMGFCGLSALYNLTRCRNQYCKREKEEKFNSPWDSEEI